ncbi:hypothetical protein BD626DRAFT_478136 [Schizophyllum amplum]|uniref:F-box domain-containing protein n=1 Tax=Schizophyllum amplum TaxID=97359 RepID=A0A550D0U0_9AGAR|nr:hypothetical protein BD626DRAFT_478136 [Auriculariopsis ampla]
MHAVLRSEELRDLIFSNLVTVGFNEIQGASSAAAVARTCRDFVEPALRVLWATHWSFHAFVRLLPDKKVVRTNQGVKLIGILTIDDLARVRYYGTFVREFLLNHYQAGIGPHDLTQILLALQGHPLFPNLHSFEYLHRGVGGDDYIAPCLPALISRSVKEVYLNLHYPLSPDDNLALEMSILFSLKHREISILDLDVVDNIPRCYAELLTGWITLRHLHLNLYCSNVAPTLVAASTLQGLYTLTLHADTEVALQSPRMGPTNMSLKKLVIRGRPNKEFAADAITILHPLALISLHVDAKLTPEAIRLLSTCMHACCLPDNLKDISFGDRDDLPKGGNRLILQDILPLFAFTGLVNVAIHVVDIRFDDTDVARLAAAWPRLRALSLRCASNAAGPACTLASLLALARSCPALESLALTLDATELPADQLEDRHELPRPPFRLRQLDVMRSPIGSEPEWVASFLTRYFPHLRPRNMKAGLQDEDKTMGRRECQRRERWTMVKRLLPVLMDARKTGTHGRGADRR